MQVERALCWVGQTFTCMGARNPRHSRQTGHLDFRISQQLRACHKANAPAEWALLVPVTLVMFLLNHACAGPGPCRKQSLADMICLGFHFLLRPGKCTGTINDNAAFTLGDVSFAIGTQHLKPPQHPGVNLKPPPPSASRSRPRKIKTKAMPSAMGAAVIASAVPCAPPFVLFKSTCGTSVLQASHVLLTPS